jgi:hypothetical protein
MQKLNAHLGGGVGLSVDEGKFRRGLAPVVVETIFEIA